MTTHNYAGYINKNIYGKRRNNLQKKSSNKNLQIIKHSHFLNKITFKDYVVAPLKAKKNHKSNKIVENNQTTIDRWRVKF